MKRQIKKRKIAKQSTKEAHREINHLISSLPTILVGLTRENEIIHWNAVAEKVFKIPAAKVMGTTLDQCGIQWDWQKIADGIAQSQAEGCSVRIDNINFRNFEGEERYLGLTITPSNGEKNSILGVTIIGADITERALMNQLNQSQKIKSIGQLAAGIAHEINTPTQYVGDNIRFLQEAFDDLSQACGMCTGLLQAVKSGSVGQNWFKARN